jgi:hypothetical protein
LVKEAFLSDPDFPDVSPADTPLRRSIFFVGPQQPPILSELDSVSFTHLVFACVWVCVWICDGNRMVIPLRFGLIGVLSVTAQTSDSRFKEKEQKWGMNH